MKRFVNALKALWGRLMLDKHESIKAAYARLFETQDGKVVLEHLRKMTVDRDLSLPAGGDGHAMGLTMAFQSGENNVYRAILKMMKRG